MSDVTDICVLVCGGGNAAQVVTGLFSMRYKTIAVSFFEDEAARWKAALGNDDFELTVEGAAVSKIKSKPADITNDPSVAAQADVIILAVPSFAHGEYFEKFAPHMKPGTIVGVMPARSGGDILFNSKLGDKAADMVFVGFETLPWACRFSEWGRKATILGTKNTILAAVTPPSAKARALGTLQGLLGCFPLIVESPTNLAISLRNPGMVVHPGVMYGRWCPEQWDGQAKSEKPLFYQGVDDFTETALLGMTKEVQSVCRKMEKLVPGLNLKDACTLKKWYMDCYGGQMSDTSTLKACMNTNKAYDGLMHPCKEENGGFMPDLKYRYLAEDVPTGLCFAKGLAEIIGVKTPSIDKVLEWAQGHIGLEIMVDGKMTGKDLHKTRAPQGVGVTTTQAFIEMAGLGPKKREPREAKPQEPRKPRFHIVGKIRPDSAGLNLKVKVVSEATVVETKAGKIWEVRCGDKTGTAVVSLREMHKDLAKKDGTIVLRNAKATMVASHIRIGVDKWGKIEAGEAFEGEVEMDEKKNVSSTEYELVNGK